MNAHWNVIHPLNWAFVPRILAWWFSPSCHCYSTSTFVPRVTVSGFSIGRWNSPNYGGSSAVLQIDEGLGSLVCTYFLFCFCIIVSMHLMLVFLFSSVRFMRVKSSPILLTVSKLWLCLPFLNWLVLQEDHFLHPMPANSTRYQLKACPMLPVDNQLLVFLFLTAMAEQASNSQSCFWVNWFVAAFRCSSKQAGWNFGTQQSDHLVSR